MGDPLASDLPSMLQRPLYQVFVLIPLHTAQETFQRRDTRRKSSICLINDFLLLYCA
jgi:hypothetical protein